MAKSFSMILDTCALLWLANGDKKLSQAARKQIGQAAAVYVSAISGFEIALKCSKGKLTLPKPVREWFDHVVEHHGLIVLALEAKICLSITELPPVHDDPCDRFIIATAIAHGLTVVTADERFEQYGVPVIF